MAGVPHVRHAARRRMEKVQPDLQNGEGQHWQAGHFIGADAGKPKRPQQHPKADLVGRAGVAFVSPDKKSKWPWLVCHACGKQHKGNWEKCNQISKMVRANIGKLVKAETFDDKSGGSGNTPTATRTTGGNKPTKKKRGAVNVVVEEKGNGEETEAKKD